MNNNKNDKIPARFLNKIWQTLNLENEISQNQKCHQIPDDYIFSFDEIVFFILN